MNNNNNSVSDNYHCNISSKQKLVINFPYFHKMYVYFNTNLEFRVTKTMTYLLLHYLPSVVSHYSLTNKNLVRSNWHPQQITESQITIQSFCYNHHHLQRERARQTEGWRSEVGFGTMKDQATNPYEKDYSDSNNPTMTSKKNLTDFFPWMMQLILNPCRNKCYSRLKWRDSDHRINYVVSSLQRFQGPTY